jgi:putative ABC transport system ATP-binding protein
MQSTLGEREDPATPATSDTSPTPSTPAAASAPDTVRADRVIEATDLVRVFAADGPGGAGNKRAEPPAAHRALDGVTLHVDAGRFVSIMGPSGSGKSTLLHLLGGLDRPTSGEVRIAGRALGGLSDQELTIVRRRTIGFVFQSFNLVPVLTAEENIALPLVLDGRKDGAARTRVDEAIATVGLDHCRDRFPNQLSGGEQQRAAIARAIVTDPPLLLADEPTGNLDSATGAAVLHVLRALQREQGRTVLVVTHDPRVAAAGDEVVELRDGRIGGHLDLSAGERGRRPADRIVTWLARD